MEYKLTFILLWQDVKLPLVLSQTFDQAQLQSELSGENAPLSVSIWILAPFRYFLSSKERGFIRQLKQRCAGVRIRVVPGINRIGNFPMGLVLNFLGQSSEKIHSVFHFRGESSFNLFHKYYKKKLHDKFILDVRGYWPAELLYAKGIEAESDMPQEFKAIHQRSKADLIQALNLADGIITVSENLKTLLQQLLTAPRKIHVVPCCVKSLTIGSSRDSLRATLGISTSEKLLVYSGGYARYQHLEDLTLPFFNILLKRDINLKVLILSQHERKIRALINLPEEVSSRFIFVQANQNAVGDYLSACDLGFLLRKETLVNVVAQPVKVGEYLAAGVPVCVEGEVGGVTQKLIERKAGLSIHIDGRNDEVWLDAAQRVIGFLRESADYRINAQNLAKDYFLWENNIPRQRKYYFEIMNEN